MTITLFGQASTPADNGANVTNPTVVTPPGSMASGDLVLLFAHSRATSGTLSMSQAGGQSWTSLTQHNTTTCRRRIFWCIFNNTWSANPSVTIGTTCNTVVMLVFRPTQGYAFSADQALTDAVVSAPGSPFTVTITGQTIASNSVCIAAWACIAANTWGTLAGAGWSKTGLTAQYRNTSGSDQTSSFAYFIGSGVTGNVSQNESAGTAGASSILSFKETQLTYSLAVDNLAQAQAVGNVALTQHNILAVDNLAQAQAVDSPTLTYHAPSVALVVDNMAQAQAVGNVALTQHNALAVDGMVQAQAVGAVSLTQHNVLVVDNLAQAQAIENVITKYWMLLPPIELILAERAFEFTLKGRGFELDLQGRNYDLDLMDRDYELVEDQN